jgi:hypothetical protein
VEQAERLVAKFPEAALDPITRGARASDDERVRQSLVRSAANLKGDGVTAFLRDELQGRFLGSRVAAARGLVTRGDDAGVRVAVKDWQSVDWSDHHKYFFSSAPDELIEVLAHCGDPFAVRALGDKFREKPFEKRRKIVESFSNLQKDLRGRPLTPETRGAVDELLASALDDREVTDRTVADSAADLLAQRWGEPGLFDASATWGTRERMRLEVKNAWRKRRGEEPLAIAGRPTVKPAPDESVRPLLAVVRTAETAEKRRGAIKSLAALGLPALPAVRKLLASLKPGDPVEKEVASLAERLAMTVAVTGFSDDSLTPGEEMRKRVDALRGKTINSAAFLDTVVALSRDLPPGVRGAVLTLERPGDDTGATVIATLIPEKPKEPVREPEIVVRRIILLDKKEIENGHHGFGGVVNPKLGAIDWSEFQDDLTKVLPAKPEQYLLIQAGCELRR